MLRNEMWRLFEVSGNIYAYLYYKNCLKFSDDEIADKEERLLQGL